jgi:hypothetical protein
VLLQCADLLKQAKTKYGNKDLMGALKLYEDVLAQVSTGRRNAHFASVSSTGLGATAGKAHNTQLSRVLLHCCHHHKQCSAQAQPSQRRVMGPVAASNSMQLGIKQQPLIVLTVSDCSVVLCVLGTCRMT